MKDIIRDGHPTLRKVAEEVPLPPSEEDKRILRSLLEYVINSQDEGIAKIRITTWDWPSCSTN